MSDAALNSHENRIERMAETGAASALLALVLAASRAAITAIVGPWPEIFVGTPGVIWWAMFGACLAVAAYSGIAAVVMMCRAER